MTRRLSAVPDAVDAVQCLLCGKTAETYADLCDRCAGVFAGLADRIAAGVAADLTGDPDAVHVPGQLELEDPDALGALELDDVRNALWNDDWSGVSADTLRRAWVRHADQFSLADLRAIRAAAAQLGGRA